MFYSGWQFRTPSGFDLAHLQSPVTVTASDVGVGLGAELGPPLHGHTAVRLHVSPQLPHAGEGLAGARGRGTPAAAAAATAAAFHIRSNRPLIPQLGVAYMEVRVEGMRGPEPGRPPSLILGLCTSSLPSHKLPGEQENSTGLFQAQSMVYTNGTGLGERVAMPAAECGEGAAQGKGKRVLQQGDTLGVLVDFLQGIVRFTCNGVLLAGAHATVERAGRAPGPPLAGGSTGASPAAPWAAGAAGRGRSGVAREYFFALGFQRGAEASMTLRVVMLSGVPPGPPGRGLAAAQGVGGTGERSGEGRAEPGSELGATVFDLTRHVTQEAARRLRQRHPRLRDPTWQESALHDGAVHAVLRQFFAARGMTRALASLEHEAAHLTLSAAAATAACPGPGTADDPLIAYTADIAEARRLLMASPRTPSTFSPTFLLSHHVLPPSLRRAFYMALGTNSTRAHGGELLPPTLWGLLLFSRRMDLLFVLKALQAAEQTLHTVDQYLVYVRERHGMAANPLPAHTRHDFDTPAEVEARLLAAYSATVMRPMEEQQRRAARGWAGSSDPPPPPPPPGAGQATTPTCAWQQLAQLPAESLRDCFWRCMDEADAAGAHPSPPATALARAEMAAAALMMAAVPPLAAPNTPTQLRLGGAMASFFTHTHAFFTELAGGAAGVGREDLESSEPIVGGAGEGAGGAAAHTGNGHRACPPRPARGGSPAPPQSLPVCVAKWAALVHTARMQYRRRAFALLQRCLEECAVWVGATLHAWVRARGEACALGLRPHPLRGSNGHSNGHGNGAHDGAGGGAVEEEREAKSSGGGDGDPAGAAEEEQQRPGEVSGADSDTTEAGLLHTLTHAPRLPRSLRAAGAAAGGPRDEGDLLHRLPPRHPTLRAMHRRCLAVASLDPQGQVQTEFFLSELRVATAAGGLGVDAGRTAAASTLKRPSASEVSAATASSSPSPTSPEPASHPRPAPDQLEQEEQQPWLGEETPSTGRSSWAVDEFYLASLSLQRVHRYLFP